MTRPCHITGAGRRTFNPLREWKPWALRRSSYRGCIEAFCASIQISHTLAQWPWMAPLLWRTPVEHLVHKAFFFLFFFVWSRVIALLCTGVMLSFYKQTKPLQESHWLPHQLFVTQNSPDLSSEQDRQIWSKKKKKAIRASVQWIFFCLPPFPDLMQIQWYSARGNRSNWQWIQAATCPQFILLAKLSKPEALAITWHHLSPYAHKSVDFAFGWSCWTTQSFDFGEKRIYCFCSIIYLFMLPGQMSN